MNRKFVFTTVLAVAVFIVIPRAAAQAQAEPAAAQAPSANAQQELNQDVKLLREDIRAKKKQLIAANLNLTPDQATKFWPLYDQYTAELVQINNEKYAVLKEYATSWGSLTDEQALSLTNRALAVDQKVAALRIKYVPIFNKAVPGKTTASFFQLDRRIQAMIDMQLAAQIPLVQSQDSNPSPSSN
jgi:Spy/CpxP family protein refolding chaperone